METAIMTNTLVVQQCYGYFSTGNIPALLENLADDVKWIVPGPKEVPIAGVYEGKAAVGRFFATLDQELEITKFETREFIEQNNKVVVLGYDEGRAKKTGKVSNQEWAMVFTLRAGKVVKFQEYSDTYKNYEAFKI